MDSTDVYRLRAPEEFFEPVLLPCGLPPYRIEPAWPLAPGEGLVS